MKMRYVIPICLAIILITNLLTYIIANRSSKGNIEILEKLKETQDSLQMIKYNFSFDGIQVGLISAKDFVIVGDTFHFSTFVKATNTSNPLYYKKPFVVVAYDIDTASMHLKNIIDTFPANNWESLVKIKTVKKGTLSIYGEFHLPIGKNNKFRTFPFRNVVNVVNKEEFQRLNHLLAR